MSASNEPCENGVTKSVRMVSRNIFWSCRSLVSNHGWPMEARIAKAKRGAFVTRPCVGYVKVSKDGRLEKNPDQRVQRAITLLFSKALEVGSAHGAMTWFIEQGLQIPVGNANGEVYTVEDRAPRVHPWVNESGAGVLLEWKRLRVPIAYTGFNTMSYGFANTGVGS